jgi:UDP-glucose 6-dehydrogenase
MDVSVFGTGYVGLIQAAALADVGHRVLCVDIDPNKIKQLQQAVPPISEPGLSGTLEENIKASDAVEHANAPVICTELKNFRVVDFDLLASKLRSRVIVDGRNLYNPEQVSAAGLHYSGIGIRHIVPEVLRP